MLINSFIHSLRMDRWIDGNIIIISWFVGWLVDWLIGLKNWEVWFDKIEQIHKK